MSRNGSGTYSLPEAPFVPNTTISSAAMNSDLSDIADALTDSLSRTGLGAMQAQLGLATSGFAYSADPDTGMSRSGANTQVITVGGDSYTITQDDFTNPDGVSLLPLVGEIRLWALPDAPTGWIFMRGQACTTTYPLWRAALIAASNPYGTSGSDPLFPNMQCVVPAGFDATGRGILSGSTTLGLGIGVQSVTLSQSNLPNYNLPSSLGWSQTGGATVATNVVTGTPQNVLTTGGSGTQITGAASGQLNVTVTGNVTGNVALGGSSASFSIVQPTIILNYIGRAA